MSKEIQQILKAIDQIRDGERAVLATVVDLKGSGYRRPGARMLIAKNGDTSGTISGGCLEADVLERAKKVLETGVPDVFVYDTTAQEDSVFSLNMGCRGVIRILLEPIERGSKMISMLHSVWNDRRRYTIATFIGGDGGDNIKIGERVFVGDDETLPVGASRVFAAMPGIDDDLLTFHGSAATSETMRYVTQAGEAEFAFETLRPPVLLAIFGAGADAVPLARMASELGWQTNAVDHRPAFLTSDRFPGSTLIQAERDAPPDIATDGLTAIISVNHNYERDRETLSFALRSEAFYIGALGPKKRTEQILVELRERGEVIAAAALARLRYPAGLDIGGDTPESIAVAIIAEIQSVLTGRPGGTLRDRDGSIYDR